jgi:UDP-N-acetyl-D-glucosamine dehydrogenase
MFDAALAQGAPGLIAKLRAKQALIGVVGLGYVGLPLCLAFAEAEVRVLGFDIDPQKAQALRSGSSYLKHINATRIARAVDEQFLDATADASRLGEPDAILICVPTPLTAHQEPDLRFIQATVAAIAERLRPGQVIVLESTTYPGTTQEVVLPVLEATGLKCGRDFWLAFSPEREDPGNLDFSTARIPKVVGADDADSRAIAIALYETFAAKIVPVSSAAAAEAVKITENIFRAVNIALVNELKGVYAAMGIDIWEVIDAAKTKPFGFMPFYPGPGLGGHCIPIDPFYLTWRAREFNMHTRFIELAGQINSAMPERVVEAMAKALDLRARKGLNGARILVLGLAYKKNIDDTRESPSLRLIELLEQRGAAVDYHDPHVPIIPPTREHASLAGRASQAWDCAKIASYDAVLIATDHDGVDYAALVRHAKLIVDTRNACARAGAHSENIIAA